ncbi:MAG TPA: ubiquinol-cytochrome c reductase cytochrome b subunit [Actinomycetota bacterium]|nr:ubiquinol-cytochrome c reductase cytochrome b subunit [Actinomycetota bacterium]
MIVPKVVRWMDERLRISGFSKATLRRIFPDHWSFLLGEIAMYLFLILVGTGIFLTFFFSPSAREVVYNGSYAPLRGQHMSQAYESLLNISFEVRSGLVMRQIHHWSALLFVAVIVVHMMRVFFTGAFRKPRELNWIVGLTLLTLALLAGFSGYSLPDDLLSGTGLRIGYSVALSIPVVGTWLAFLVFGGEFPFGNIISRLYVIHILLIPGAIGMLLGLHLAMVWRQKHTQFAGPLRSETKIVGTRMWPTYAIKATALFFLTAATVCLLAGLFQINPIWVYGPFDPAKVSAGAQPDWYLGWLEGGLRLMPPWEVRAFGLTIPNPFFPGLLIPGLTFNILYAWPWIESKFITKDREAHNLLNRPSDVPVRTAIGVAGLAFYAVLFVAGGNDVIAGLFNLPLELVTRSLQVLLLALPLVSGIVTYRICRQLKNRGAARHAHGHVIVRTSDGSFETVEPEKA